MEFEDQIKDIQVIIERLPRTYIKWKNTEPGRDKSDCYERIVIDNLVMYVNVNNRNLSIISENPFWNKLEKIYNSHPVLINEV